MGTCHGRRTWRSPTVRRSGGVHASIERTMMGAFGIGDQALVIGARTFRSIADRRQEHPASELRAAFMPARVRSERTSLSNCANAASTASVNFPVDVSSIGLAGHAGGRPADPQGDHPTVPLCDPFEKHEHPYWSWRSLRLAAGHSTGSRARSLERRSA